MGKFTIIPQNTFNGLEMDAGCLLWRFDPETGAAPADEDIITATTNGINVVCQTTYSDLGSDIDNVPNDTKELKHLDGRTCTMSTTALGMTPDLIALEVGAADVVGSKITARMDLKQTDFKDIWWVGDKANGGFVAVQLLNALSTNGFSLQTSKNGKGQVSVTFTGHVSIAAQKVVPMVFYSQDAEGVIYEITYNLTNVTSETTATTIAENAPYATTLSADTGYTISSVTVTMGGVDVTSTVYTTATGAISIPNVSGNVIITATATED